MSKRTGTPPQRQPRIILLACLMILGGVLSTSPAWAHGGGETEEGYLLVQQALGYLADDPSDDGVARAMEKIDDALNTVDQEGMDVAEVTKAAAALEAGNVPAGGALLQDSITEATSNLEPATGEETGTTVLVSAQDGRGNLGLGGWLALSASVVLLLLGAAVAWRFRPKDNVQQLRRTLGSVHAASHASPPSKDGR